MTQIPNDPVDLTLRRNATMQFKREKPSFHWVGVLTPIGGKSEQALRVRDKPIVVGREGGLSAVIKDDAVSRRHARITRKGKEFVLEDLGSSNGTHVDGCPVTFCLLHDGDTVQIGRTLFYFERLLERDHSLKGAHS